MCKFCGLILLSLFLTSVYSHSYLTAPTTRTNQRQTNTGCRDACKVCDGPTSAIQPSRVLRVQRGQSVVTQWPRNNHPGGFVRYSWAPTAQSGTQAAFDQQIQLFSCYEKSTATSCRPSGAADGPDTFPSDGSTGACEQTITIPLQLADGQWTLQWAWFGGGFALGDYYSCVDFEVAGGPTSTSPMTTLFEGGDFANPSGQACKYFNTRQLGNCPTEPCNNPPEPGSRSGMPLFNNLVPVPPSTAAASTVGGAESSENADNSGSGVNVAAAVLVPLFIVLIVGAIIGVVLFFRFKRRADYDRGKERVSQIGSKIVDKFRG